MSEQTLKDLTPKAINTVNLLLAKTEQEIMLATGLDMTCIIVPRVKGGRPIDVHQMVRTIASAMNMLPSDMLLKDRHRQYVHLRVMVAHFIRMYFPEISLKQIAEICGHSDHSSAIHALESAADWIDTREEIFYKKYERVLYAVTQFFKDEA